jgi:hypothetical protein
MLLAFPHPALERYPLNGRHPRLCGEKLSRKISLKQINADQDRFRKNDPDLGGCLVCRLIFV